MYLLSSKSPDVVNAMFDSVESRFKTDINEQLFTAYADAYVSALLSATQQVTISGTILGGTAIAGGPLIGGLLTCAVGSLVTTEVVLDVKLGACTHIVGSTTLSGNFDNAYQRALRSAVAEVVTASWSSWASAWSATSLAVASGGAVAWIASTPPVAGPWTLGTITPFVLAPQAGIGGASASQAIDICGDTIQSKCSSTPWTFTMPEGNNLTLMLTNSAGADTPIRPKALLAGWKYLVNDFVHNVNVHDATGCGASGIGAPTTGSITSGTIQLKLQVG